MRTGEVADHPVGDVLGLLAARELPVLDALIGRAQPVRAGLASAQACGGPSLDGWALLDGTPAEEPLRVAGPVPA